MRVLFASTHDLDDRRVYSGITYHMRKAFERAGATVIPLGPLRAPGAWWMKPRKLAYRALGREHERLREPRLVRAFARQIEAATLASRADIAFGTGVHVVGAVTEVPFACWPDATFSALYKLYDTPRPFSRAAVRNADALERHTFAHATAVAFSSDWARASAVEDYAALPDRVATVPYGANLESPPSRLAVHEAIAQRPIGGHAPLELLFVGKDFVRKGGPAAVALTTELRKRGFPALLRVVGPGSDDIRPFTTPWVIAEGFLNAQVEDDRRRLASLYANAHVFVLPTQADCTPMVLVEAMAHGVPCLTTRVGGIPSQVVPGTGLLMDVDAPVSAWADALIHAWASPDAYRDLARGARSRYDAVLNWDHAARTFLELAENRLRTDSMRPRASRSTRV